MNYDGFKKQFAEKFREHLPEPYCSWELKLIRVPKVNGIMDAISMVPKTPENIAVPNLYIEDLYQAYLFWGNLETVLEKASQAFVSGMEYTYSLMERPEVEDPREDSVFMLINTEMNKELLQEVPHRSFLDMTIIYRLVLECPGEGFNSAIIDQRAADAYDLDEDELFRITARNTPRKMPPLLETISDTFYLLTNQQRAMGAGVLLYDGVLDEAAEKIGSDLFVLPSSIHEVFLVPDLGQDLQMMRRTVIEANRSVVKRREILSDNVYRYSRKEKKLAVAVERPVNPVN